MTKDKFDMDAETVKLDLDALISVAAIGSRNALDLMQRTKNRATEYPGEKTGNENYDEFLRNQNREFWSQRTAEYALEWAKACKAYHYLVRAKKIDQTVLLKGD